MTDTKNIDATKLHGPEHVRVYEQTDGEVGHDWRNDSAILILTTTGRKSGEERKNALIYGMHGDNPVIVASKGGNPQHPGWYVNLRDDSEVQVQIYGDKFTARARDATPEERPELWKQMTGHWPPYDEYQKKTDREIPLVILERVGGNHDPKFSR